MVVICVGLMTKIALANLSIPPPDPDMVSVNEPVGELLGMVSVSVEEKSGIDEGTLKVPLTPLGSPSTAKETCELKPFKLATLIEYEVV
jgi:hypothetical protein